MVAPCSGTAVGGSAFSLVVSKAGSLLLADEIAGCDE